MKYWFSGAMLFSLASGVLLADASHPVPNRFCRGPQALGAGTPGALYVLRIKKDFPTYEACAKSKDAVLQAVQSAVDQNVAFLAVDPQISMSRGKVSSNWVFFVEPWTAANLSETEKTMEALGNQTVEGISLKFEKVDKFYSSDTVELLKKDQQKTSPDGKTTSAIEVSLVKKTTKSGYTGYRSWIQWCQTWDNEIASLTETSFSPTAALIQQSLTAIDFSVIRAVLPLADAINIAHTASFQAKTGELESGIFGISSWRDCTKLSCVMDK